MRMGPGPREGTVCELLALWSGKIYKKTLAARFECIRLSRVMEYIVYQREH